VNISFWWPPFVLDITRRIVIFDRFSKMILLMLVITLLNKDINVSNQSFNRYSTYYQIDNRYRNYKTNHAFCFLTNIKNYRWSERSNKIIIVSYPQMICSVKRNSRNEETDCRSKKIHADIFTLFIYCQTTLIIQKENIINFVWGKEQ